MKEDRIEDNLIVKLTFEFALLIIEYCHTLQLEKKYIIANQLMKSGTSIGANVWEAQNAESRNDFIHKFKIAAKETDETHYWLLLCNASEYLVNAEELLIKLIVINKIINRIITTSKKGVTTKKKFGGISTLANSQIS